MSSNLSGLELFRTNFPEYNDVDDRALGAAVYQKYYTDIPKEEFDSFFFPVPPPPTFGQSLGAGVDLLQQAAGGLTAGVGKAIGSEDIERYGKDVVERNRKEIEEAIGGSVDWRNIRNVGDFTQYASQVLGLNAAQMAYILGAGATAQALVPPVGLPGVLGKAGAFAVGSGAAALPLFTGMNVTRQLEEGQEPQLGKAAGYALPQAAVEMAFAGVLAKIAGGLSFKPTTGLISRVGKSAGEAIAAGVPSEVVQQALERKAADLPVWIDNEEALGEYLDSAVGALVLSGALGGGAGVVGRISAKGKSESEDISLKDISKFETEIPNPETLQTVPPTAAAESTSTSLVPVGAPYNPPNFVKAQEDSIKDSINILKNDFGWTDEMVIANTGSLVDSARKLQIRRAQRDVDYSYEPIELPDTPLVSPEEASKIFAAKQLGEDVAAGLVETDVKVELQNLEKEAVVQEAEANQAERSENLTDVEPVDLTAAREVFQKAEKAIPQTQGKTLSVQRAVNDFVESAPEGKVEPFEVASALEASGNEVSLKDVKDALENLAKQQAKEGVNPFLQKDDKGNYIRTPLKSPSQPRASTTGFQGPVNAFADFYSSFGKESRTKARRLRPEVINNKPLLKDIENYLRPMLQDEAKIQWVESLQDDDGTSLAGLQLGSTLYVALNGNGRALGDSELLEAAAHEAWHFVSDEMKVLTPADRRLLERARPKLIQFVAKNLGTSVKDIETLVSLGPVGVEELHAYAFGFSKVDRSNTPANSVFNKVWKFLEKLGNFLNRAGFRTYEDLFTDVTVGKYDIYNKTLNAGKARAAVLRDAHLELRGNFHPTREDTIPKNADFGHVEKLLNFLSTQPWKASKHPFFARMFNSINAQSQTRNMYEINYQRQLDPLLKDKPRFNLASNVISYLRETGQPIQVDDKGNVVYQRDGKTVALESSISNHVVKIQELMRNALLDKVAIARERLRDYDIPDDASIQAIEAEILAKNNLLIKMLEVDAGNLDEAKLLNKQIETLEVIKDYIKQVEDFVGSNRAYVPFMRFGDVGVVVKDKEGNVLEFTSVEKNIFTGKYSDKVLNELVSSLKKKYPDATVSEPFNLTKDNITNKLNNKLVTTELLSSLIASGDDVVYNDIVKEIQKDISLKGFAKHFDQAEGIPGYSKDWERAISAYLASSAMYNAQMKHGADLAKLDADIEQLRGNFRDTARKDFDYALSPVADMSGIRAANFLYTMGLNLSTAFINLITLPTSTASLMLQFDGNIVKHWGTLSKAFSQVSKLAITGSDPARQEISKVFSRENIAKNFKDAEERKFLQFGSGRGIFQESLLEDALGASAWSSQTQGGKFMRSLKGVAAIAGWPIGWIEMTTRTASGLSIFRALNTPEKIQKVKEIYKNDARFNDWMANLPEGISEREAVSFFMTQEAHAVFNREGRGNLQRGVWGAFVTPFMTYPLQTLDLLAKQAFKRGAPGKAAATYSLLAYFVMGGMMALPGAELWKAIYEAYHKITKGTEVDMMNEIRKTLVEEWGFDPKTALTVTGGAARTGLGVDISRRMSLPFPVQQPLIALSQGDSDARSYLGVFGGLLGTTEATYKGIAEGQTPVGAFAKAIAPVAFRNMWRGLVEYTGAPGYGGVSTGTGMRLANPEELTIGDIVRRTVGFTPAIEANQRELQRERQLQRTGYQTGLSGFRERIAKKTETIHRLQKEKGDPAEIRRLRTEIQDERKKLATWARENDLITDNAFWNGFNTSVVNRVYQRLNPGGVQREQTSKQVNEKQINEVFRIGGR